MRDLIEGMSEENVRKEAKKNFPDDPEGEALYNSIWKGHGGSSTCEHKNVTYLGFDGYVCEDCKKRWI